MTLCLVTDRRRLCADGRFEVACRCLVAQARSAIEAGVDLVQIRERDLEASQLFSLVCEILRLARGTSTRVVVNDRLDVALAAGAHGVHLRADSVTPTAARSMAPAGFVIGRSVHGLEEAARVAPEVDYVMAGTVFPTPSKPGAPLLGVNGLSAIAGAVPVPVLAIGGISIERVGEISEAGAAGVAAVGLFIGDPKEAPCRVVPLLEVAEAVRRQFDSLRTAS